MKVKNRVLACSVSISYAEVPKLGCSLISLSLFCMIISMLAIYCMHLRGVCFLETHDHYKVKQGERYDLSMVIYISDDLLLEIHSKY